MAHPSKCPFNAKHHFLTSIVSHSDQLQRFVKRKLMETLPHSAPLDQSVLPFFSLFMAAFAWQRFLQLLLCNNVADGGEKVFQSWHGPSSCAWMTPEPQWASIQTEIEGFTSQNERQTEQQRSTHDSEELHLFHNGLVIVRDEVCIHTAAKIMAIGESWQEPTCSRLLTRTFLVGCVGLVQWGGTNGRDHGTCNSWEETRVWMLCLAWWDHACDDNQLLWHCSCCNINVCKLSHWVSHCKLLKGMFKCQ